MAEKKIKWNLYTHKKKGKGSERTDNNNGNEVNYVENPTENKTKWSFSMCMVPYDEFGLACWKRFNKCCKDQSSEWTEINLMDSKGNAQIHMCMTW